MISLQFHNSFAATVCYPTPVPYIIGSLNGDTVINGFELNESDFIIGGSTTDTDFLNGLASPSPLMAYIKSGGSTY
jgi:hypothetical protein